MRASIEGRLSKLKAVRGYREPLLEAIANSIQSISVKSSEKSFVNVNIELAEKPTTGGKGGKQTFYPIKSICVSDNGVGFNENNFMSFETMDSQYKKDRFGCKGIGRLLWLKAFDLVEVYSVYEEDDGSRYERKFNFSVGGDVSDLVVKAVDNKIDCETSVTLSQMKEELQPHRQVTAMEVVNEIIGHFLIELVNSSLPRIRVSCGDEVLFVADEFEKLRVGSRLQDVLSIDGYDFIFVHQRLRVVGGKRLASGIYYCAGDRVVCRAKTTLDKRLDSILKDVDDNEIVYVGLIQSPLLNDFVDSERTRVSWESSTLFKTYPTENEVLKRMVESARSFLREELKMLEKASEDRLRFYVDNDAPEYKGLFNQKREDLFVDPSSSKADIDDYFLDSYHKYEKSRLKKVRALMSKEFDVTQFESRVEEIQNMIMPIAQYTLVKFAATRYCTMELLHEAMRCNDEGKFKKESTIHSLIFPMRAESTDKLGMDHHNLWIVDDRLAFNHYLASDIPLSKCKTLDVNDNRRPDILACNLYSSGKSPSDMMELSIVEFKRPGRDDYTSEDNPVDQVMDYVDKIRDGEIRTLYGEEISNYETLPIYCYIVANLTDKLKKRCERVGLVCNVNGDCYYGYNESSKAYFEVMNFNALYRKAFIRNHAMFHEAGLK